MKKKIIYIIPLLLLVLGLLGCGVVKNQAENSTPKAGVEQGSAPVENSQSTVSSESCPGETTSSKVEAEKEEDEPASPASPIQSAGVAPTPPAEAPGGGAVTVELAVVGNDGEVLFGPSSVKLIEKEGRGVTALGALAATELPYGVSRRWPDFVDVVAGLRNKGQAGWLYKVNEEVPLVAADKKHLADGDRVIWWYSKSISSPPPTWEQLTKRN